MQTQYIACPNCKSQNPGNFGMCSNCGCVLPSPSMPMQPVGAPFGKPAGADKKILSGVLGIVLGAFGIHKFVLGYNTEGIIMLVASLVGFFLCGIPTAVMSIVGIVEGIIYLTKSDEDFTATYIYGRKPWF